MTVAVSVKFWHKQEFDSCKFRTRGFSCCITLPVCRTHQEITNAEVLRLFVFVIVIFLLLYSQIC
jgi:hypothetical protein